MRTTHYLSADLLDEISAVPTEVDDAGDTGQINVAPTRRGALWKVISSAIRCPVCRSTESKAITGKRRNAQGMTEHYRVCSACEVHFRVVLE